MQEAFIHYLWKFKKLKGCALKTTRGEPIKIMSLGTHNHFSGPDFFNARLNIDGQDWAGNIEMHLKASDWYLHGHDDDPAYDNVILHVVWTHDAEITRRDHLCIPVLEVSRYVDRALIETYQNLFTFKQKQFINCERQFGGVSDFIRIQWLEKLFIERLEYKSNRIKHILSKTHNDWEATFFHLLARSFGTKTNADAFEQLASSIDTRTVHQLARDAFRLESVFLGQSGLLDQVHQDRYFRDCAKEFAFAKAKYQLQPCLTPMQFFKLRPANYPTIRLAQLAMLYHRSPLLFGELLLVNSRTEIHKLFEVKASAYWDTHHLFDQPTAFREKSLTPAFIDLLIINCIVPIKLMYRRYMGQDEVESLLELMQELPVESNTVTKAFKKHIPVEHAMHAQALLQLKSNYCDTNQCLRCDIGVSLLSRPP